MSEKELKSTAAFIKRIVIFCLEHKGRCFEDWDAPKIFKFCSWHYLSGHVFITEKAGKINGVAIAWKSSDTEILMREALHIPVFEWDYVNDKGGTSLYISQVFGSRESAAKLWRKCLDKWPEVTRIFLHRKNVLKEFSRAKMERFCK